MIEPSECPLGKLSPPPVATGWATTGRSRPTAAFSAGSSTSAPMPDTTRKTISRYRRRTISSTDAITVSQMRTVWLPSRVTNPSTSSTGRCPATALFSAPASPWSTDSSGSHRSRTSTRSTPNSSAPPATAASRISSGLRRRVAVAEYMDR